MTLKYFLSVICLNTLYVVSIPTTSASSSNENEVISQDYQVPQTRIKRSHDLSHLFKPRAEHTPIPESSLSRGWRFLRGTPRDLYPDVITREDIIEAKEIFDDLLQRRDGICAHYYDAQVDDLRKFYADHHADPSYIRNTMLSSEVEDPDRIFPFSAPEHEAALRAIASAFVAWFNRKGKAIYLEEVNIGEHKENEISLDACIQPKFVIDVLKVTFFEPDHEMETPDLIDESCGKSHQDLFSQAHFIVPKYINSFLKDESIVPDFKESYLRLIDATKVNEIARWSVDEMLCTLFVDKLEQKGILPQKSFDILSIITWGKIPQSRAKDQIQIPFKLIYPPYATVLFGVLPPPYLRSHNFSLPFPFYSNFRQPVEIRDRVIAPDQNHYGTQEDPAKL